MKLIVCGLAAAWVAMILAVAFAHFKHRNNSYQRRLQSVRKVRHNRREILRKIEASNLQRH